jgi:hypothetical protein
VLRIFIALKNPSPWPGFEPETFASSGQHTNNATTMATIYMLTLQNTQTDRLINYPVSSSDITSSALGMTGLREYKARHTERLTASKGMSQLSSKVTA